MLHAYDFSSLTTSLLTFIVENLSQCTFLTWQTQQQVGTFFKDDMFDLQGLHHPHCHSYNFAKAHFVKHLGHYYNNMSEQKHNTCHFLYCMEAQNACWPNKPLLLCGLAICMDVIASPKHNAHALCLSFQFLTCETKNYFLLE